MASFRANVNSARVEADEETAVIGSEIMEWVHVARPCSMSDQEPLQILLCIKRWPTSIHGKLAEMEFIAIAIVGTRY